jgi:chemotaxis protein MotB
MHAFDRSLALAAALLLAFVQSGCVTKGKYETVESERSALEREVESLARELDVLTRMVESTEAEAAVAEAAAEALISELEAELQAGEIEVRRMVDGVTVEVSDSLLFGSASATLSPKGLDLLARVAGQLKDENAIITVEGHTDSWPIGPKVKKRYDSNWELGAARAALVVKRLSVGGVDPARLRVVSYGPFDPIASNDTAKGRARNRRTEIIVRHLER